MPSGPTAPVPLSAVFAPGPQTLTLEFSTPIDAASSAASSDFTLHGDAGTFAGSDGVTITGTTVVIGFTLPGDPGGVLTCAFVGGAGTLIGTNGLDVADFAGFPTTRP